MKKYQKLAARTNAELEDSYDEMTNIHMVLGIVTEAGELADPFKKNLAYKKPIDWTNVKEEIGDLMWYILNMCEKNGWDLTDIIITNIAKLKARYPEKFTQDDAVNRDLETERQILEG